MKAQFHRQTAGMGVPHDHRRTITTSLAAGVALAAAVCSADGNYQFIVTGYPAQNESRSAESAATALVTGTSSASSEANELESRYRTRSESVGIALKSTRASGAMVIFR